MVLGFIGPWSTWIAHSSSCGALCGPRQRQSFRPVVDHRRRRLRALIHLISRRNGHFSWSRFRKPPATRRDAVGGLDRPERAGRLAVLHRGTRAVLDRLHLDPSRFLSPSAPSPLPLSRPCPRPSPTPGGTPSRPAAGSGRRHAADGANRGFAFSFTASLSTVRGASPAVFRVDLDGVAARAVRGHQRDPDLRRDPRVIARPCRSNADAPDRRRPTTANVSFLLTSSRLLYSARCPPPAAAALHWQRQPPCQAGGRHECGSGARPLAVRPSVDGRGCRGRRRRRLGPAERGDPRIRLCRRVR